MIPHDTITSAANPRVRQAALLRQADARRQTGLTLVDGRRELAKASAAGVPIVDIFLDARVIQTSSIHADSVGLDRWLNELCEKGTRIVSLSPKAFDRIAFGGRNEGCVGVVAFAAQSLERLTLSADCPVLLVEGIEKPGNLGAILRTADATGMAGVIVDGGVRDLKEVRSLGLPIYGRSVVPSSTVSRFAGVARNVPVQCAGVEVKPGDIIVADEDGVVRVPAAQAAEVLKRAQEIDERETKMVPFIRLHKALSKAVEVFNRI